MILYTISPYEHIFPEQLETLENYKTITYNGIPVVVECQNQTSLRIDRIMSTDPAHYLDQNIQPGTIISLVPEQPFKN